MHDEAPAVLIVPGAQLVQTVELDLAAKVPAAQLIQEVAPRSSLYFPASHAEQVEARVPL